MHKEKFNPFNKTSIYCEDIFSNKTPQCNKRMQEKNLISTPFSDDKSKTIFKWWVLEKIKKYQGKFFFSIYWCQPW